MQLIDRYVIRTFIGVFMVCLLSLSGIYIISDFVNNVSEFVDHSKSTGNLLQVLATYYAARLPWFFDLMSPVVALIACVFVLTWLQRNNEMTAIMAAGSAPRRVAVPLIGASLIVSILAAANREFVIPTIRDRLSSNAQDWTGSRGHRVTPVHDPVSEIWLSGREAFRNDKRITDPDFHLPASLSSVGSHITAEEARYVTADEVHPGGYILSHDVQPATLLERPSIELAGQPIISTPVDNAWLTGEQVFVACDVPFEQLDNRNTSHRFSSTPQIVAGIRGSSFGPDAELRVTVHKRLLQPVLDMSLLLLGIPVVMRRASSNVFASVGVCILVVLLFSVVVLAFHGLGTNYLLAPAVAAWCPVLIFVPAAAGLSAGWWY